ncbi:hypothetical protein PHLCEN_2v8027 [Hermanssonia centrifuga]|uniref:Uncharacterized protein n=1 Tax=Hermanssonia centrifuga TaxID=98765 RepID=A0A2R6NUU5_9APHY|nr:hypothetical protein PHLCEN_2v8027 [Hermanssonia centrifuga]
MDLGKASEALKTWGNGEGDDLGDTLTASTALLLHVASALSRFSSHESSVREQMKAVRTREENLDDMKRRRKSLMSSADSADRKLSKMSAEHKNFQAQADALNKLRDEIRAIDTDIMNEEANLGDFKRSSAKNWMGLKFGGLMELCEKGVIVGELGKLVIAEIPLDPTEPGLPRPYYTGHARTEFLVAEAHRAMSEVYFSTDPNPNPSTRTIRALPGGELPPIASSGPSSRPASSHFGVGGGSAMSMSGYAESTSEPSVRTSRYSQNLMMSPGGSGFMGLPEISGSSIGGLPAGSFMSAEKSPSQSSGLPPTNPFASPSPQAQPLSPVNTDVNEFGAYPSQSGPYSPRSTSLRNLSDQQQTGAVPGPRGGRFATFPTKGAMGPRAQPGPSSISSALAPIMDDRVPSIEIDRGNDSFSSSVALALGQQWVADDPRSERRPSNSKMSEALKDGRDDEPPPPKYSPTAELSPNTSRPTSIENELGQPATPSSIAPPSVLAVQANGEEDEDTGLAYMSPAEDDNKSTASSVRERGDRRVRFGGADDIDEEQERRSVRTGNGVPPTQIDTSSGSVSNLQTEHSSIPAVATASSPVTALRPEEEERALNAAAAREVSRELDALMMSSPPRPIEPLTPPVSASLNSSLPFSGRGVAPRGVSLRDGPPSPASLPNDSNYLRERDRSGSIPTSPISDSGRTTAQLQQAFRPVSPPGHEEREQQPLIPPPSLSFPARSTSPSVSTVSTGTPYRTPPEYPMQPTGPGSFYNLPAVSGSGSFSPTGRTITAAAFKRQIRNPSTPTVEGNQPDTSPLIVKKRPLPSSPYPGQRVQPDYAGTPRIPSASAPGGTGQGVGSDWQNRSSPMAAPRSSQEDGRGSVHEREQAEDDDYDYISAYVDNPPHSGSPTDNRQMSSAGYNHGQFATNLEDEGGLR